MIKKANLEKELFVVLTLKPEGINPALKIQKKIIENYNLYEGGPYPQLHITLDRISRDSIQEAKDIIGPIIAQSQPIDIELKNFKCFFVKDKLLVLDIVRTPSLVKLANIIHQKLISKGISTIENYDDWSFHMTILNNSFSQNPMSDKENNKLCLALDGIPQKISTVANRLEIWGPSLDPKEKVFASFKI